MATELQGMDLSLLAGEDLSAKQFHIVKGGTAAREVVAAAAATDMLVGVLQDKPEEGEICTVRFTGITKVKASGALATPFTEITSDADGKAAAASSGNSAIGFILEPAGAEDDIISAVLYGGKRKI